MKHFRAKCAIANAPPQGGPSLKKVGSFNPDFAVRFKF